MAGTAVGAFQLGKMFEEKFIGGKFGDMLFDAVGQDEEQLALQNAAFEEAKALRSELIGQAEKPQAAIGEIEPIPIKAPTDSQQALMAKERTEMKVRTPVPTATGTTNLKQGGAIPIERRLGVDNYGIALMKSVLFG